MEYPNLMAAWRVLVCDNVPAQIRPDIDSTWPAALAEIRKVVTQEQVDLAEQALGQLRQPDDEFQLDSPLWTVCSGDPSDCEDQLRALAGGDLFAPTHAVLEELFEATGYAVEWAQ